VKKTTSRDPLDRFAAENPEPRRGPVCWVCSLTQEVDGHRVVDLVNRHLLRTPQTRYQTIARFVAEKGGAGEMDLGVIASRLAVHKQRGHALRKVA
jgi:hypothetical protein